MAKEDLAARPDVSTLAMIACYPTAEEAAAIVPAGGNQTATDREILVANILQEATPEGDCLLSPRAPSRKYAAVKIDGKYKQAHGVIFEATWGPMPLGMVIHHRCWNKRCVNIDHLEMLPVDEHSKLHHPRIPNPPRRADPTKGGGIRQQMCSVHGVPYERQERRGWNVCRACQRESSQRYRDRRKKAHDGR